MLTVVSASRRTDLVRCYPRLLAQWLAQGEVVIKNPYNQQERKVDLRPERVHTLVLWSKDFSPLLANHFHLKDLVQRYQQCYFHFTITGLGQTVWEPGVIASDRAAAQLEPLLALAGDPRRIMWRFDPILFWKQDRRVVSNLAGFNGLAKVVRQKGLSQVMVSLCHWYQKAIRRTQAANLTWIKPKGQDIQRIGRWLRTQAHARELQVLACSHPGLLVAGLLKGRCINGSLLASLHPQGLAASRAKAAGQRKDCGCTHSIDIGSYDLACPHGCVYCYANAKHDHVQEQPKAMNAWG